MEFFAIFLNNLPAVTFGSILSLFLELSHFFSPGITPGPIRSKTLVPSPVSFSLTLGQCDPYQGPLRPFCLNPLFTQSSLSLFLLPSQEFFNTVLLFAIVPSSVFSQSFWEFFCRLRAAPFASLPSPPSPRGGSKVTLNHLFSLALT